MDDTSRTLKPWVIFARCVQGPKRRSLFETGLMARVERRVI
jgi:hypothetical protein